MKDIDIVSRLTKKSRENPARDLDGNEIFEIYFEDLVPEVQAELLRFYNITDPGEMNWDAIPLAILTEESLGD